MSPLETESDVLLCPSSRAESPQSAVFGIVDNRGVLPIIRYLERPIPATAEVLSLAEGENPNDVFRFTSPCQNGRCAHFSQGECGLPRLLQENLPPTEKKPVPCPIRSVCRWFHQIGFAACAHCSAVVTGDYSLADGRLHSPFEEPAPPEALTNSQTPTVVVEKKGSDYAPTDSSC